MVVDIQLNLTSESVRQAGLAEPVGVEPDTPLQDVLALMKEQQTGHVLICKGGTLQGIFTERDALRLLASGGDMKAPISQVMSAGPTTLAPEDSVAKAIQTMSEGGYRRLPIVDERGQAVGVIKVSNIIHYMVEHFPRAVYNLPPDPQTVMPEREGA